MENKKYNIKIVEQKEIGFDKIIINIIDPNLVNNQELKMSLLHWDIQYIHYQDNLKINICDSDKHNADNNKMDRLQIITQILKDYIHDDVDIKATKNSLSKNRNRTIYDKCYNRITRTEYNIYETMEFDGRIYAKTDYPDSKVMSIPNCSNIATVYYYHEIYLDTDINSNTHGEFILSSKILPYSKIFSARNMESLFDLDC